MVSGDCAGGERDARAYYERTAPNAAKTGVQIETDLFCPIAGDAETVKRRLLSQTSRMSMDPTTCHMYLAPARKLASAAATDMDKRVAGSVEVAIAKCFSSARQCTEAQALIKEAAVLVPGIDNSELTAACR
jgi:hypothetical protein